MSLIIYYSRDSDVTRILFTDPKMNLYGVVQLACDSDP